eukprot:3588147-Pyramimonas_sp.AAC.1
MKASPGQQCNAMQCNAKQCNATPSRPTRTMHDNALHRTAGRVRWSAEHSNYMYGLATQNNAKQ